MGALEIFDWCPGDYWLVSSRLLIGVLEIFGLCPCDIWWLS